MKEYLTRKPNGFLQQWAAVDENIVYWTDNYEELNQEFPTTFNIGVMQNDPESPVIVMSNAETLTLYDTTPQQAVILFNNLLCDRETAREE